MFPFGGDHVALVRALVAPLRRSRYRTAWMTGLVTGALLAVSGFILIGPFLALVAPLFVALFLGGRTAMKPQFAGRGAGAAAGAMARASLPILIGTILSWAATNGVVLLNSDPHYPDPAGETVLMMSVGLFLGVVVCGIACGIAAIIGAIRGKNNRPWPVLPAIYD